MPELPEVEASRKFVEDHCLGHPIVRAIVQDDSKVLCDVSARDLEQALTGRTIIQAHRKGKHLWFELDQRPWPAFQFGMTGAILIKNVPGIQYKRSDANDEEEWPSKYSKVRVELENGVEMAFTDKRRFAHVRLLQDPPTESPISELGPDAYLECPPEETFVQAIQLRKGPIKRILLDQTFLAGIGNWIADEVLYQARIHPEIQPSSMTSEDCKSVYRAIKEVVEWSVKLNADHNNFPKHWLFHYRWNRKPAVLGGLNRMQDAISSCTWNSKSGFWNSSRYIWRKEVQFITVGGKTSAYVPALQKCRGLPMLSIIGRRRSRRNTTSLAAGQVTNENFLPPSARGKILSAKRRKSSTCDVEEVVLEEGLAKTSSVALIELATEGTPNAPGNNSARRRKKSDTGLRAKGKRGQVKAVADTSVNIAEGEQDTTVEAIQVSRSRLQNMDTQIIVEDSAMAIDSYCHEQTKWSFHILDSPENRPLKGLSNRKFESAELPTQ